MVLGVPWEAVSLQGAGPASFATGRGVVGGAQGQPRWPGCEGPVLTGRGRNGVPESPSGQKRALGDSRDKVHTLGKGKAAPLRWDSEPLVTLPAPPLQAGNPRRAESVREGPGS